MDIELHYYRDGSWRVTFSTLNGSISETIDPNQLEDFAAMLRARADILCPLDDHNREERGDG